MPPAAVPAEQPAPRLARLDLHGFKSFANRTVFVFEPGITAVVGPNGSGKSNISDAVRWVLGETSYSALRSKRTEDVIFAGGRGKPPAGMAEVTVTFNNEEGWLPSDFTEVTVTRRAFRSGENQYFINGRRMRLKDVTQLTASLGQSYTVVGQGLVDVALSQKAEERRGLFEHAADLAGLRLKVAEAERSLNEADANTDRLRDLMTELEPRLKSLQRSAKQAREWQGLRERQAFLQRGHYRRLMAGAGSRLAEAEAAIAGDERVLAEWRSALQDSVSARAQAQERLQAARDALASHDARLATIREGERQVGHQRDLVVERERALDRRREDMRDTQSGLDEQVAKVERDLGLVNAGVLGVTAEVEEAREAVTALEAASQADRQARTDLERDVAQLASAIGQRERTVNDLAQRQALIEQKRESVSSEEERVAREAAERLDRIARLTADAAALVTEDEETASRLAAFETRLAELAGASREQRAAVEAAAQAVADAERRFGQATNRLAVLQRVQDEGTGLHAGVRQVLQAHRDGRLDGIRGTVAELISVEATYDTAIEVALGGHLQDVVVDRWRDAEAAIALLKGARAGRATFQPLETLARRGERPAPSGLDRIAGVYGVASDLVRSDGDHAVVVRALLGRIVVVEDLPAARRAMAELPSGWSAVTLAGEIARAGGSVTGGSAVRESGVLGRERDLRELPAEIERLERRREETQAHQAEAAQKGQALASDRTAIESERAVLLAQRRERGGQRDRLAAWLRDLRAQQEAADTRSAAAAQHQDQQEAELRAIAARREGALRQLADDQERHAERQVTVSRMREAAGAGDARLATARQDLAALDERLRAEGRRVAALQSQRSGLAEEMALRSRRVAELEGERDALAGQRERLEREVASLAQSQAAAVEARVPLAGALVESEAAVTALESRIERARQELLERERGMTQGSLAVERARSELATVHQRIIDDLGLEHPEDLHALPDREIEDGDAGPDWVLSDDHEAVEKEISRLRDRLRRVGYVGDDVVEEYERESAHFDHLTTQLQDVMEAALSIRGLLAGLTDTMQDRFAETFERVAGAFTEAFTVLFGGGTARLVLTADDEGGAPGGIDIVAQPPGKRLQSLGLLSGGERSLTAVALLFAILRVNPTPFVLLDEVDAALDEANVVRFRDELRKLAAETQAIVITHNRGTVEIADTLYGVTMGGDGVSQVLSLRLGDLPLDEEVDIRDLPSVAAGVPVR
jgi:chromosome segregation protein